MDGNAARRAAHEYRRLGWSVIPIRTREKVPLVAWETYQSRRASEAEIDAWFQRHPDANIGIVTGEISNLVVLDIDPQHGGAQSLDELESRNEPLPRTVEAITGGGGRHLYFTYPPRPLRNRAGLVAGLDLRGQGGMVVAPPSIHPSGRAYAWAPGRDPAACDVAALPQWIVRLAAGPAVGRGRPMSYWRTLAKEGVAEGMRNSTIASFSGHLLWHGVDPDVVIELLLCWNRVLCRPPLEDDEVVRTVESIARLHGEREEN